MVWDTHSLFDVALSCLIRPPLSFSRRSVQTACRDVEESERLVEKLLADVSTLRRRVGETKQGQKEGVTLLAHIITQLD